MMIDFCACRVLRFNEFESKILISLVIRRNLKPVNLFRLPRRKTDLLFCLLHVDMCEIPPGMEINVCIEQIGEK